MTRLLVRLALDFLTIGFFFVFFLIAIIVMWIASWFVWAIAQSIS